MRTLLRGLSRRGLALAGSAALVLGVCLALAAPALADDQAPPAGPPYPAPVDGQRVYDHAGIFSSSTDTQAEQIIAGIETRSGAQVVVYTQVKPESDSLDRANRDAAALIDQWGIGHKGLDDSLVILFDMEPNLIHGQVSLYAGSGFKAAFMSDDERQHVFDDDMSPLLHDQDFDGALLAALHDVDGYATPEHAAKLRTARAINSWIAVGGVLLAVGLILVAFLAWLRHGRDPVYVDDSSILMPAPPVGLTPAMATVLLKDGSSERTVSAGLLDLAARGTIDFRAEGHSADEISLRYLKTADEVAGPEGHLLESIKSKSDGKYIASDQLYRLRPNLDTFKTRLEADAVKRGWLARKPSDAIAGWESIGAFEITAALVAGLFWLFTQASGLVVLAAGLLVAGIVTIVIGHFMPTRTKVGAMLWAMLAAYRRTLDLRLKQSKSMGQVVAAKALPWVTTPDQVMAWGVAFGLNGELESLLRRSMERADEADAAAAAAASTFWQPTWWHTGSSLAGTGSSGGGSSHLFSASAIPDPGAIFAALGSVSHASAPYTGSSGGSSGGFGGGFSSGGFGGGSSGGGGGAGGGF